MTTVYFNFKGINCSGCIAGIRKAVRHLGVSHFEYDDDSQKAHVIYDRSVTNINQIIQMIKRFGLEPEIIETIEES